VLGGAIVDSGRFDAERSVRSIRTSSRPGAAAARRASRSAPGETRASRTPASVAPRFGPTPSPLNAFLIGQGSRR
jgi:O-acetylhomoserine (thiol)-lyase